MARQLFEIRPLKRGLEKPMKALRKLAGKSGIREALEEALAEIQYQIGQEFVMGGQLTGYTKNEQVRYRAWKNKKNTRLNKEAYWENMPPGVMGGYLKLAMRKGSSSPAYAGTRVIGNIIKIRINIEHPNRSVNYAGFFDDSQGLIPSKMAVKGILRNSIALSVKDNLKKAGFS
tara:strand:- start:51 stop:572 length:522 start_codon:yes stop_codon:yes gene_type:complete